jgi:hypothetical protein
MCRGRVAVNTRIGVVIKENLREGDFPFLFSSADTNEDWHAKIDPEVI